jgi:hypothetical protein
MNQNSSYSTFNALYSLSNFKIHAFTAFGKRAEFSDALWFPTWSGHSVGGRLARAILNESLIGVMLIIINVWFETFIQGFLRCRMPVFFLPPNWLSEQTSSVLQTWRDFNSTIEAQPVFHDKFFGDFFECPYANNELAFIDFVTDNIPDMSKSPNFVVGRSSNVRFCHLQTILEVTQLLFRTVPSTIRMMYSVPGAIQKLACLVIWFGLANQRSRHAFALYQFLNRNLTPILASLTKPPILYLPYETQPEQNALAAAWSEAQGESIGYIHGTMLTFPAHYLRPLCGAVNRIWCHGSAYPSILNLLGWSLDQIERIKSLRFRMTRGSNQEPVAGSVYFPYWSGGLSFATTQIEDGKKAGLIRIQILKPHPATGLSKGNKRRFEKIISHLSGGFDQIISIGPVSVPLEELERGTTLKVIHIPLSNAPWDSFCLDLWSMHLDVEPIAENIHAYRIKLKHQGAFIEFNNDV